MTKLISSLAVCALVAGVSFAGAARAEDLMKKDTSEAMMKSDAMKGGAMSAGTKDDCMQKAAMETDDTKKAEMMKACDATQ